MFTSIFLIPVWSYMKVHTEVRNCAGKTTKRTKIFHTQSKTAQNNFSGTALKTVKAIQYEQ